MFPNECTAKLSSVLSTVDGDLNKAAASLAGCVDDGTVRLLSNLYLVEIHCWIAWKGVRICY